jgi:dolichol-phosphate mannosyltransferase
MMIVEKSNDQLQDNENLKLTIVITVYNEEENIFPVVDELYDKLEGKIVFDLIIVDDGSQDATSFLLQDINKKYSNLRVVRHSVNYGKSTAIITGVKASITPWIATMDGDGQNNPDDILTLYDKLQNLPDPRERILLAGRRRKRNDNLIKRVSSFIANRIRSLLLKDDTLDTACGLKIFSRKMFLYLPKFNNMHRFMPALYKRADGKVISVDIDDRPRIHGKSKYNLKNRLWVGIFDLFGMIWLQHRSIPGNNMELREKEL